MRETINTQYELCTGCNRCVRECPMEMANITYQDQEGNIKVKVDHSKCIACGRCISACKHNARYYQDDTDLFFSDLRSGVPISIIAAPSIRTNIPEYKKLFTYLKQLGVRRIYDVSLGADICIWAHIRYLGQNPDNPMITQPCPAIVSYCEIYRHELLKNLSPIQSPMGCTSIYMKEYGGVEDHIAALSPCIAKTNEFESTGLAGYNVTFMKLLEYLEKNHIVLPDEETGFDYAEGGMGGLFPMPGGLKENIEYYAGKSLNISRAEGFGVYQELDTYAETPEGLLPQLFDVLSCYNGCNTGSACPSGRNIFEIDMTMHKNRKAAMDRQGGEAGRGLEAFDKKLDISRFIRKYNPVPSSFPLITEKDIRKAFKLLGKTTKEMQNIDCGACGSETCLHMARKIALKVNIPDNCIVKSKEDAKVEHDKSLTAYEQLADIAKIRETDEHMRIMLDATPFGAQFWDRDLRMIDCNQATVNLLKLTDKQVYLERFYDFFPEYQPDGRLSRDAAAQYIHQAFDTGYQRVVWMNKATDGEIIPSEITLVRVDYKEDYLVVAYLRDLRQQERMIQDIEQRDVLFRAVRNATTLLLQAEADEFESALWGSMGIMAGAVDADRVRLWKNRVVDGALYCDQLYEWSEGAEPTQGMHITFGVSYDEDLPGWERILSNGECINDIVRDMSPKAQMRLIPQNILSLLIVPVFLREEFWGFVGFNDCHRERLFTINEESILRSGSLLIANALLRNEMTQELETALEKAQAASRAKSEFLSNMSHEIRTPMNSIMGFSELAVEEAVHPKTREYLGRIMDNAKGLLQIINDILDISKIESGNMELENIPFDLHELLTTCKSIVSPKAIEKNINLHFYAEPSFRKKLYGDPTKLRQVLINLLSNAVKFTEAGKVSLITYIEHETEDTITLRFEIRDSGIGMTPEQISRVFEPFTQADVSTTRKYGGTGLVLAITKSILDLMDSGIEIESAPGEGTQISFTVTIHTVGAEMEIPDLDRSAGDLDRPTFEGEVLVCEDNKMNQRVIVEHLSRTGLSVEIAENGLEGIEKVSRRAAEGEKPYDLIFMDIHMPVMDGLEAAQKIIGSGSPTPVVAMTANIMTEDRELYKELGMSGYVGKPFTSQELWRCLLLYLKPLSFTEAEEGEDELQNLLKAEFVRSNQQKFEEITGAAVAGDITLAHRLAHSLKSNAGQIGMLALQAAAAEVEASLKNGAYKTTEAQMGVLQKELALVLEELKPYDASPADQAGTASEADPEKARAVFEKLEPLLKSGNPECLNLIGELRAIPGSGELIMQIEDFYFSAAEKTLAELRSKYAI